MIASFTQRFLDFRSCWIVFIHVVRRRPGDAMLYKCTLYLLTYYLLVMVARSAGSAEPVEVVCKPMKRYDSVGVVYTGDGAVATEVSSGSVTRPVVRHRSTLERRPSSSSAVSCREEVAARRSR